MVYLSKPPLATRYQECWGIRLFIFTNSLYRYSCIGLKKHHPCILSKPLAFLLFSPSKRRVLFQLLPVYLCNWSAIWLCILRLKNRVPEASNVSFVIALQNLPFGYGFFWTCTKTRIQLGNLMIFSVLNPVLSLVQVLLFCMCMGGIMYYLEHEPDTMAPFLRGLIRRFLASRISNPSPPPNRNASYTYLQTLDVMNKPKLQENHGAKASPSAKYNLESIPGL